MEEGGEEGAGATVETADARAVEAAARATGSMVALPAAEAAPGTTLR